MHAIGRYTALVCAAGIVCAPKDAFGQANQQNLDEAVNACEKGDFAKAIPIFRRITADRDNMNAHLHFAVCLEKKNDWLEAISVLDRVIDTTTIIINSNPAPVIVAIAKKRKEQATLLLDDLQKRIPKLQFLVSGDPDRLEQLQVDVNGHPLERARWNQVFAVNPGTYRFTSRSPDGTLATMVVVAEGDAATGIKYPAQLALPADPKKIDIIRRKILTATSFGLGAAGLVAGAVFVGLHADSNGSRDSSTYRGAAIGSFVAGGLLLAGGIALAAIGTKRSGGKPDPSGNVTLMVSPWGASVGGRF